MAPLVIFAAVVLLLIVAGIVAAIRRHKKIKWVKEHGKHVQATVSEITSEKVAFQVPQQVQRMQYNSVHRKMEMMPRTEYQTRYRTQYRIIARYGESATKQEYVFKSEPLLNEPKQYMRGTKVWVYYDPANPKLYFMELT